MQARRLNQNDARVVEDVLYNLYFRSQAQVTLRVNLVDGKAVFGVESDGVSATGPNLKPLLDEFYSLFSTEKNDRDTADTREGDPERL